MDTSCKGSDYYDQFLDTTEGRNSIYDHISHPFPLHEYFVTLEHCLFLLISGKLGVKRLNISL